MVPSREGLEHNCRFTDQMSGPFGRDLPEDRWTGLVDVIRHILQGHAEAQDRKIKGENPAWFDVHAARRVLCPSLPYQAAAHALERLKDSMRDDHGIVCRSSSIQAAGEGMQP
jgi:hypothetical protein